MRSPYPTLIGIHFSNLLSFRVKTFVGIVNLFLVVVVNVAIWSALYGRQTTLGGIEFSLTLTNLILGIGISSVFTMNEFAVADRVRSGNIAVDLMRPGNYALSTLAGSVGQMLYRLLVEFLPLVILAGTLFGLRPPASPEALGFFLISLVIGYLLFYLLGWIFALISFWYFNIWSFVTIRNTFLALLGGVYVPYAFMPDGLKAVIAWTPFDSLWSIPIQCWLGQESPGEIALLLARQLGWVVVLGSFSWVLWRRGIRKLVVQGG